LKKYLIVLFALLVAAAAIGCGSDSKQTQAYSQVDKAAKNRSPYIPHNNVEFNNYNNAQKLYDDPTTIIWCTAFPQSSTEPLITVPITGKLTSSSTTYFDPQQVLTHHGDAVTDSRSVDGMYHPNPPPYRFGFTPGGQYVDLFNLPTLCTTKPLSFQRQSISVKVDGSLNQATQQAQTALKQGDKAKAQQILQAAAGQ
jgi:hypothetical protein